MSATRQPSADAVGIGMYLLAAFLFALNGVVAKSIIQAGIDAGHFTELRNGGSMIILLVFLLLTRPRSLAVSRREIPFLAAYGIIAFTMVQFLYFFTISRLPVGFGTLLAFLAPLVVAVYLRFARGIGGGRGLWIAIGLVLSGLTLVAQVWNGLAFDGIGVAAGLVLAVALALYWLLGERGQRDRDPVSLTFWGFAFATLAWSVILPWWSFPWDVLLGGTAYPLGSGGPGVPVGPLSLALVVFGSIVPFLLVVGSLSRIGSQRSGIIGTTEPIWATLLALAMLGEAVVPIQMAGGIVVIAGIIVAELSSRRVDVMKELVS